MLDFDACYKAVLARDPRFDGRFFVAVQTTGIYCRPICPARPLKKNVAFFASASAAESAGFRPCLRCRPDASPASPAWYGRSALVRRGLRLIANGALWNSNETEETFAGKLGASARHVRRLFIAEMGATPKQISDSNRLAFARTLTADTPLPMTAIAESAGFSSLRRFNDAFRKRYARAPSAFRRGSRARKYEGKPLELSLAYRPPYDWESILAFHSAHAIPGLERTRDGCFERVFSLNGAISALAVHPPQDKSGRMKISVWTQDPRSLFEIVRRVRWMFDLDADPVAAANALSTCRQLKNLCESRPGLRLPRGWDPFEASICAILGQLVSVKRATQLVASLISDNGEDAISPIDGEPTRLFPSPERLAGASLAGLGTTNGRKEAIREFAARVCDGRIEFSESQDPGAFRASLLEIKGVGAWTAEYVSLRALGDTDAFPGTDLILKRALEASGDLNVASLSPWRGYAALHLWREHTTLQSTAPRKRMSK